MNTQMAGSIGKILGMALGIALISGPVAASDGLILYYYWSWFLAGKLGLGAITLSTAVGLSLVRSWLMPVNRKDFEDKDWDLDTEEGIADMFGSIKTSAKFMFKRVFERPAVLIVAGWIIKSVIG